VAAISFYLDPKAPLPRGFDGGQARRILLSTFDLVPLVFIAWRSGEPLAKFGIVRLNLLRDLMVGSSALFFSYIGTGTAMFLFSQALPSLSERSSQLAALSRTAGPRGAFEIGLMIIAQVANSTNEEFGMRGFLIPRLQELLGGTWMPLLLSSALFAGYHIYQGPEAVAGLFVAGVVLGAAFLSTRSLWPGVMAHTANNVISYLSR